MNKLKIKWLLKFVNRVEVLTEREKRKYGEIWKEGSTKNLKTCEQN